MKTEFSINGRCPLDQPELREKHISFSGGNPELILLKKRVDENGKLIKELKERISKGVK